MSATLVTGATGFIGSHLVTRLRESGSRVVGASRRVAPGASPSDEIHLSLGEPFDPVLFSGIDAVVHCAWSMSRGDDSENVEGTISIMKSAADAGVPYQLFISSCSAHEQATSEYGRSKFIVERQFAERGLAVARPGLVIGDGGMYGKMASMIRRLPVVPLLKGNAAVPLIGIDDLSDSISAMVSRRLVGNWDLYLPEPIQLSDLTRRMAEQIAGGKWRVPLSAGLAHVGLRIAEAVGIGLPVRSGSLEGLIGSQSQLAGSDLGRLLDHPTPVEMLIRAPSSEDRNRS